VSACQVIVCPASHVYIPVSSSLCACGDRARPGDDYVEMLGKPLVPAPSAEGEGENTAAADTGAEAVEVADVLAPSGKDERPTQPTLDRGGRPHGTYAR
jgi:hypothetical protein